MVTELSILVDNIQFEVYGNLSGSPWTSDYLAEAMYKGTAWTAEKGPGYFDFSFDGVS